jgi:hypothetical protein
MKFIVRCNMPIMGAQRSMTFDSRLCNTVMNLTVGAPLGGTGAPLGHAGVMTTPRQVHARPAAPGGSGAAKALEATGLLAGYGRRFPGAVACLGVHQPP